MFRFKREAIYYNKMSSPQTWGLTPLIRDNQASPQVKCLNTQILKNRFSNSSLWMRRWINRVHSVAQECITLEQQKIHQKKKKIWTAKPPWQIRFKTSLKLKKIILSPFVPMKAYLGFTHPITLHPSKLFHFFSMIMKKKIGNNWMRLAKIHHTSTH